MAPPFSLDSATARLAKVTMAMHRVMQLRAQLKAINEQLRDMGWEITDSEFVVDPVGVTPQALRARARFKGLFEALHDQIGAIHAEGCTIAHIEEGYIHFPTAHRHPQLVLCWRYGESTLSHWHRAEARCDRRESIESLPEEPAD